MKEFTLRQFQTDPAKCLKSGVFKLTRYGKPIATVLPEGITQHSEQITQHLEEKRPSKAGIEIKLHNIPERITQHPQVVSDEKGNKYEVHHGAFGNCAVPGCRYTGELSESMYKEWDGQSGEWKKRPMLMCPTHVTKFENINEFA